MGIVGGAPVDFIYNEYGDLTSNVDHAGATQTYLYDSASRLRSLTAGGATATFTFDALGRNKTRTAGENYGYIGESEAVWAIVGTGVTSRISAISPDGARTSLSGAKRPGATDGSTLRSGSHRIARSSCSSSAFEMAFIVRADRML